jgi:glyceraldehyde-3-phosphate dehydrogenase (NADP+)
MSDIPPELGLGSPVECREYLLDGELCNWRGPMQEVRTPFRVVGPAGLEHVLIGSCPVHDAETGMRALNAANAAWGGGLGHWPCLPASRRAACVAEFARRMAEKRGEIVRLMQLEICKSKSECEQEFRRTIENFQDTLDAHAAMLDASRGLVDAGAMLAQVRRSPVGVVLCMGPFNFPLNETMATLIPALLMGNTAVVKLPRIGRLLFFPLMECLAAAFPRGVVNVLCGGTECVAPVMTSGKVDVLAFIGTSRAAEAMRGLHPHPVRLRCVFGLEAKNAAIVLDDADLDRAVGQVLRGAFGFNGQRCTALKLVFAQQKIAPEFTRRLAEAADGLAMGLPWEPGATITPLPEPGKTDFLGALLSDALAKGARLATSRSGAHDAAFFAPTVLEGVTSEMRVFREEQFGPLCPVVAFSDADEVLRAIAASDYGQQVSIFGEDLEQIGRLTDRLANLVSRVNIGCKAQRGPDVLPFTARKSSAVGTLSVMEALNAFSIETLVAAGAKSPGAQQLGSLRDRGLSVYLGD